MFLIDLEGCSVGNQQQRKGVGSCNTDPIVFLSKNHGSIVDEFYDDKYNCVLYSVGYILIFMIQPRFIVAFDNIYGTNSSDGILNFI